MVITKTNASAISKGIEISVDNEFYTTEEGVLFNKSKTVLIAYSKSKKDSTYVIPDSVTTIDSDAFCGNNYLTTLYINQNLQTIENGALYNTPKLTNFVVNKKNTGFIYKDNCFQTASGDIIKYIGGVDSTFNIKSNCKLIHKGAFCGENQYLTTINIPYNSTLENISKYNFNNFANQVKIEYYADNEESYNVVVNYLNNNTTKVNAQIYKLQSVSIDVDTETSIVDNYSYKTVASSNNHNINFDTSFLNNYIVGKKICKTYIGIIKGQNKTVIKNLTIKNDLDYINEENHIGNFTFMFNLDKDGWTKFNNENELETTSVYYGEHTLEIKAYYNGIECKNNIYQANIIEFPMSNVKDTSYSNSLSINTNYWLVKFNNNSNNSEVKSMQFTFSDDSGTESSRDNIYFGNTKNYGQITISGSSIGGSSTSEIIAKDNICKISFETDSSVQNRGFAIVKIVVKYNDDTTKTFDGSKWYTGQET